VSALKSFLESYLTRQGLRPWYPWWNARSVARFPACAERPLHHKRAKREQNFRSDAPNRL